MENYYNDLWPLIYDQYNQGRHQKELAFYSGELASCTGPVLEVACGTGMIFLPLLKQGIDIYGFDLSPQMLEKLFEKAKKENLTDVHCRVSWQNMIDFQSDMKFEAIFIPARSFLHLPNQDEQLACLRNIHCHLCDDGVFMLNFFTPNLSLLLTHVEPDPEFSDFGQYPQPDGKDDIRVSFRQVNDLSEQIQHITWKFELSGQTHKIPMLVRWIYKKEFELLARLSGFRVRHFYSSFDKLQDKDDGEMIWVLEKDPKPCWQERR